MKKCMKCGEDKELTFFYPHSAMKDGFLNKCKECTKLDVGKHRKANLEKIRKYDRDRGNRQSSEYLKEYRKKYPEKYRAMSIVNNAIRTKKLFKCPCEVCGEDNKVVAHHDDYTKPLNIRWLCQAHHKQWHALNGEGKY
jgi:hypothetical protein